MEIADLAKTFKMLESCCLHEPQWRPEEVEKVLAAFWTGSLSAYKGWLPLLDYKDDSESESAIAVKLKDGDYGLLTEGEDYTGHGCRCDSFTGRYPTVKDLIDHCEDEYRDLVAQAISEFAEES